MTSVKLEKTIKYLTIQESLPYENPEVLIA